MSLAHDNQSQEANRPSLRVIDGGELEKPEFEHGLEPSDWEIYKVPLAAINTFRQQREGANERQAALSGSIDSKVGMINPVNFGLVDRRTLEEYIEFTNRVWGDAKSLAHFTPLIESVNPHYVVLIAGHSRVEGHRQKAVREEADMWEYTVDARLMKVSSVDDIVAIQVAENIDSAPSPDRAARAYAESFLWEKNTNPALTRREFISRHGVTEGALRDALYYAELPPEIRKLTDNGGLPFTVAVELARAHQPIRTEATALVEREAGKEWDDAATAKCDALVRDELLRFIAQFNKDGHRQNARSRIRQHAAALREKYAKDKREAVELLTLFNPISYTERRTYLRKEIERDLREMQSTRAERARTLHRMAVELFGEPELDFDAEFEHVAAQVGGAALAAAQA